MSNSTHRIYGPPVAASVLRIIILPAYPEPYSGGQRSFASQTERRDARLDHEHEDRELAKPPIQDFFVGSPRLD
jgi:hypothetical protein